MCPYKGNKGILSSEEILFPGNSLAVGYPISNCNTENKYTSNISHSEQVVLRYLVIYMQYICQQLMIKEVTNVKNNNEEYEKGFRRRKRKAEIM